MGDRAMRLPRAQEVRLVETLAMLTAGGLTVQDAYHAASEVLSGSAAGRFANQVAQRIEAGVSPAAASATVADRLAPMHESMLAVADETGAYAPTLSRAATHLRTQAELREQAIGAAIYPAFVLLLTVIGAVLLIAIVFPAAGEFMVATGALSGGEASALLNRGVTTLAAFAGILVLLVAGFGAAALSDELRLRLPVIGTLERYGELLAFAQAVGGMQSAGVPLERAVTTAAGSLRNRYLRNRLLAAGEQISAGVDASLAISQAVPRAALVARWFAMAERGADPLAATDGLISFLQSELDRRSKRLGSVLEPIFVILAGVMIILVVVTLIQPLFSLYAEVLP